MDIKFGKYKGMTFEQVYVSDRPYLLWMHDSTLAQGNDPKWGESNKRRAKDMMAEILSLDRASGKPVEATTAPTNLNGVIVALEAILAQLNGMSVPLNNEGKEVFQGTKPIKVADEEEIAWEE